MSHFWDKPDREPVVADATGDRKPFETWAKTKGTDVHLLAGLQAGEGWAQGREVTEAEFDAAVERAANVSAR